MKTELDIAKEVMQGKWGIGTDREKRIRKAGYDYNVVQAMVNKMVETGKLIKEIEIDATDCCGIVISLRI